MKANPVGLDRASVRFGSAKANEISTIKPTKLLSQYDHIIARGTDFEAVFTSSAKWAAASERIRK